MTDLKAVRATGLLKMFDDAGVLTVADVHVATRVGALAGERNEQVLLALALVVRSTRHGSVVLDLASAADTITPELTDDDASAQVDLAWPSLDEWASAVAASPLVAGTDSGSPVRMAGTRLWLDRYWKQEEQIAADLLLRSADRPTDLDLDSLRNDLDSLFLEAAEDDQRLATAVAALSTVSVIAGGPGTGKTTTIARLIAVLLRQRPNLRVALAAPTGKAAARLEEAVHAAAGPLTRADRAALVRLSASTLHRLLGWRPGVASRFRHNRENRLPFDLIVVDECSMVSVTLMARLLEAIAPQTRLVLVGDPDQLASVEAGAVLGDLVDRDDLGRATASFGATLRRVTEGVPDGVRPDAPAASLRESVAMLRAVHRFDAGGVIAQLADHVRLGRADDAWAMLSAQPDGLEFHPTADDEPLGGPALHAVQAQISYEETMIEAARAGDVVSALDALDRHRFLCAHRTGPRGVQHWSDAVERWLAADDSFLVPRLDGRYAGQPLLVTTNDYENGLYNGDTGVVVQQGDDLMAAFRRGADPVLLPLIRLSDVRPLHAMTVHRAQGSQFNEVTVLLPPADSPLATRQTFYTAITRATSVVRLIGSEESVRACINRQAARATGLRDRLSGQLASAGDPS